MSYSKLNNELVCLEKDSSGTHLLVKLRLKMTPLDSINRKSFIHSGMMSMDHLGHVKAYVGGINYKYFQYDHVTQGKRQVGSFKPFYMLCPVMKC